VNVVGSAAIGLLGGAMAAGAAIPAELRLLLLTGLPGGFTTFSAFSFDAGHLWERAPALAFAYVVGTLAGALGAFAACFRLARRLAG
jgi:CrcB protein